MNFKIRNLLSLSLCFIMVLFVIQFTTVKITSSNYNSTRIYNDTIDFKASNIPHLEGNRTAFFGKSNLMCTFVLMGITSILLYFNRSNNMQSINEPYTPNMPEHTITNIELSQESYINNNENYEALEPLTDDNSEDITSLLSLSYLPNVTYQPEFIVIDTTNLSNDIFLPFNTPDYTKTLNKPI